MTDSRKGYVRMRTLQAVVLLIFGVIILRLAYIQLIDPKYEKLARGNALRHVVQYPPRGEIFDRNGEYLAQNRACYDLMVIYRELPREGFDTLQMLDLLGISRTKLERALRNARMSPRIPYMVTNFISSEVKLRFDENNFPGFYTVYRTIRSYPRKIGGNLLGDVGEINAAQLKRNPRYRAGDYIGQSGVEKAYEEVLRGKNGVKINEIDTHGVVKGLHGRHVRFTARTGQLHRHDDRRPPASLHRRADAGQGGCRRGERAFDGRDPDDGLLAHVRPR